MTLLEWSIICSKSGVESNIWQIISYLSAGANSYITFSKVLDHKYVYHVGEWLNLKCPKKALKVYCQERLSQVARNIDNCLQQGEKALQVLFDIGL